MNEEVCFCLKVTKQVMVHPIPMAVWNIGKRRFRANQRRIRFERLVTANLQPHREFYFVVTSIKHHDFMVAAQRMHGVCCGEVHQEVDHGIGVGTAIAIVSERDNNVVAFKLDVVTQRPQRVKAPVNITNCEMSFQMNSLGNIKPAGSEHRHSPMQRL